MPRIFHRWPLAVFASLSILFLPRGGAEAAPGRGVTAMPAQAAGGHSLDNQELRELTLMAIDPELAGQAVTRIRAHLGEGLAPQYETFMRRLLVRALIVNQSPVKDIVGEADLVGPRLQQENGVRTMFFAEVAQALILRNTALDQAVGYAKRALDESPLDPSAGPIGVFARSVLGQAQLANGECKPAIENLRTAVGVLPDSQGVLYTLGTAYEKCGQRDLAIRHYVRSLGVFAGQDTSAAAPLRALYRRQHGSLAGLDKQIDAAKQAAIQDQVFDSRRYEKPSPAWSMEDASGKVVKSADFAGKIVVLDFWGSWCGPCRMELPHFQAMWEKYRDRGVVFYGVNWEKVTRDQRKAIAIAYMKQNGLDFPNLFDLVDRAPFDFQVDSFPTVFLIDPSGQIRYRNIGYSDAISDILALQIESLLAEAKGKAAQK